MKAAYKRIDELNERLRVQDQWRKELEAQVAEQELAGRVLLTHYRELKAAVEKHIDAGHHYDCYANELISRGTYGECDCGLAKLEAALEGGEQDE